MRRREEVAKILLPENTAMASISRSSLCVEALCNKDAVWNLDLDVVSNK